MTPSNSQAFALEAAPGEFGDVTKPVRMHLVQDDADDLDAFLLEQRLVQADFVDRFADAALGDNDDFGPEHLGHLRVGQIKHRTDAGVARAFAQHEILFPRDAVEGLLNFFDQRVVIGRLEIFAREIRLDRDGAHVHQRAIEPVNAIHQHRVFVDLLLVDLHETLADRLDVADARMELLNARRAGRARWWSCPRSAAWRR